MFVNLFELNGIAVAFVYHPNKTVKNNLNQSKYYENEKSTHHTGIRVALMAWLYRVLFLRRTKIEPPIRKCHTKWVYYYILVCRFFLGKFDAQIWWILAYIQIGRLKWVIKWLESGYFVTVFIMFLDIECAIFFQCSHHGQFKEAKKVSPP